MLHPLGLAFGAVLGAFTEFRYFAGKPVDAFVLRGHGAHDVRLPTISFRDKLEHRLDLRIEPVRAFTVGFVQHENIRDLH